MKKMFIGALLTLVSVGVFSAEGTVKTYKFRDDKSVTVISIKGQAAKDLYNSYKGVIYDLANGVDEEYAWNNIGKNIACFKVKKKGSKIEKYNCDITLRNGKALSGAAG